MTAAMDVVKVPGAAESRDEQTNTKVTKSCPGSLCLSASPMLPALTYVW